LDLFASLNNCLSSPEKLEPSLWKDVCGLLGSAGQSWSDAMVAQDRRYEENRYRDEWDEIIRRERGARDDYRDDDARRYRSDRRDLSVSPSDYGRGREISGRDKYARFGDLYERRPGDYARRNRYEADYFLDDRQGFDRDIERERLLARYEGRAYGRDYANRDYLGYGGNTEPGRPFGYARAYGSPNRIYEGNDQRDFGRAARGPDYDDYNRDLYLRGGRGDERRPSYDRGNDDIPSWFEDEEAARRREADLHRGRGPKNYVRSDERIREDLSDQLADDPYLDASNIEVAVAKAEITLNGVVPSRNQKRRAEDHAECVSGVTHVQNNLRVRAPEHGAQQGTQLTASAGNQKPGNAR
jgi:osmotically-inducible protein OsmY